MHKSTFGSKPRGWTRGVAQGVPCDRRVMLLNFMKARLTHVAHRTRNGQDAEKCAELVAGTVEILREKLKTYPLSLEEATGLQQVFDDQTVLAFFTTEAADECADMVAQRDSMPSPTGTGRLQTTQPAQSNIKGQEMCFPENFFARQVS